MGAATTYEEAMAVRNLIAGNNLCGGFDGPPFNPAAAGVLVGSADPVRITAPGNVFVAVDTRALRGAVGPGGCRPWHASFSCCHASSSTGRDAPYVKCGSHELITVAWPASTSGVTPKPGTLHEEER